MWYTHFLKRRDPVETITETQQAIVNEFYRKALSLIIDDKSWFDLFNLSKLYIKEDKFSSEFNECFHEYWCNEEDNIIVVLNDRTKDFEFCKTNRKLYDPVIVLAYTMLSYTNKYEFTSDWNISMFDLSNTDWLSKSLREYINNELYYTYNYQ